ncbi:MAG: hybrid sensor histidine kinase/response regulator [Deltaproteobacteria bacterium]|jgi:two-component system, NtrC family, sensor kinase|nr:hybrid sensor histidine kinase/response regulator [Deltaproteobacteria bacterium]
MPKGSKRAAAVDYKSLEKELKSLVKSNEALEKLVGILERGKYMWESTFDAITSPVQIVSQDYKIMRANIALSAVCSKDIREVVNRRCYEVFAGRKVPCDGCPLEQSIVNGEQITSSLCNKIAKREFEVSVYPYTKNVEDVSVVLYYRDITEERRLQREIIQQEKMAAIGMLAGGVAHEINNPLGGIIAFTQLLKKDVKGNKDVINDIEVIEEAAGRCKKIVADLLDFSRISKDGEHSPLDINVILEKVFPFIRREMQSLNVELFFDGAGRLPYVMGASNRLQQVFLNLMTNACHAMEKGGKLAVTTGVEDGGRVVAIRVRDTGAGINSRIKEQIFDPFFTTKDPGKGTGLGLSISYRIVKEHGGTIEFEDVEDGGTEFVIRLPAFIEE